MQNLRSDLKKIIGNALYGCGSFIDSSYFNPMLGNGIILCYHSIGSNPAIDAVLNKSWLSINVETFRSHIKYLSTKFECVSIDRMLSKNRPASGRRLCCITFDDGYRDNLYSALPVLEEFQVPATVFVTTFKSRVARPAYEFWPEFIGLNPVDISRLFMSASELKQLSSSKLITIGAHGDSHMKLSGLTPAEVGQELNFSKKYLEDCTGKPITHFAYPHGTKDSFSGVHINALQEMGFLSACTTSPERMSNKISPYRLPRTLVLPHVCAERISILSSGLSNIIGRTF